MANDILKILPPKLSLRFKQLFQSLNEVYADYTDTPMNIIRGIWDTEYDLPEDVTTLLFNLFGFNISDLKFFNDNTRKIIKNQFADNIFSFYRNKLNQSIYSQLLYIYGLRGNVRILNTRDWTNFFPGELTYFDRNLYTDVGLTTDLGYFTDNLVRTPFIELEVLLNKKYTIDLVDYLWFSNINLNLKSDVDNIRYVLTRVFYKFSIYAEGESGETIVDPDSGIEIICEDISDLKSINKFKLTFEDSTTITDFIYSKDIIDGKFNYEINYKFLEDNKIVKIELLNLKEDTIYVTINTPKTFIQSGDTFYSNINVSSSILTVPYDLGSYDSFYYDYENYDKKFRITRGFWG